MDFEELIETLSRGSATAVTTLESNVAELNAIKEYLYVETPVEQALRGELDRNLKIPRIIFVCRLSLPGRNRQPDPVAAGHRRLRSEAECRSISRPER